MQQNYNRIRLSGQIHNDYEYIVQMTDEQLDNLRLRLDRAHKKHGDIAIDSLLGELCSDSGGTKRPVDCEFVRWSAEIINDRNVVVEFLEP